MSYFEFPHTRTYDSDLGWLIKYVHANIDNIKDINTWITEHNIDYKELQEKVDGLINSLIEIIVPWDSSIEYKIYSMVEYQGTNYIAVQDVPVGVMITNTDYWIPANTVIEQINAIGTQVTKINKDIEYLNRELTIKDLAGKAISHRGYGWDTVILPNICQNTIPAFQIAMDNGYIGIETDVRKDVNGVICCFHDDSVGNLTNGTGYFKDNDYQTLRLKNGNGLQTDTKINTFEEVCRWASSNGAVVETEMKRGTNTGEVSIEEALEIAANFQTKVIINCHNDDDLLLECQENFPDIWKRTNNYYLTTLTKPIIDTIAETYYNLIIYIRNVTDVDPEVVKYAYEKNILITRGTNYYSSDTRSSFGMTFSTYGRPNYTSPLVYDSGWIYPDELLNGYTPISNAYRFGYRRIGNIVYLRGLFNNITWESLPTSEATRKILYVLPELFRPAANERSIGNINDGILGFHMFAVYPNGNCYPCYRVSPDVTVEILNSNSVACFISYTASNIKG